MFKTEKFVDSHDYGNTQEGRFRGVWICLKKQQKQLHFGFFGLIKILLFVTKNQGFSFGRSFWW